MCHAAAAGEDVLRIDRDDRAAVVAQNLLHLPEVDDVKRHVFQGIGGIDIFPCCNPLFEGFEFLITDSIKFSGEADIPIIEPQGLKSLYCKRLIKRFRPMGQLGTLPTDQYDRARISASCYFICDFCPVRLDDCHIDTSHKR